MNDPFKEPPARLAQRSPLTWVLIAAALGIVADRTLVVPIWIWVGALLFPACALVLQARHLIQTRPCESPRSAALSLTRTIILLCLVFSTFAAWHHRRFQLVSHNHLARWASTRHEPVCIEGVVRSSTLYVPQRHARRSSGKSSTRTRFELNVERIRVGRQWRPVTGVVQVQIEDRVESQPIGSRIQALGMICRPSAATNPGEFDHRDYLRGRGVHCLLYAPGRNSIRSIEAERSVAFAGASSRWRQRLREHLTESLDRHHAPAHAAFARATLLGDRSGLSEETLALFRQTGISHLLAISGLHLGILCCPWFVAGRLGLCRMRLCLVMAIIFVWLYCWFVGFRPPVTRAAVLISVFSIAKLNGREPIAWNSLSLAALIVVALNPSYLFDTGAQLSFVAVATLIQCQQQIQDKSEADPIHRLLASRHSGIGRAVHNGFRSSLGFIKLCAAIWLATAPIIACQYGVVTPIALVVNPLVMLPASIALYSGASVLLLAPVAPWLANLAAVPGGYAIEFTTGLASWGSAQRYGHLHVVGPSGWWVAGLYGWVWLLTIRLRGRLPRRWKLAILSAWCAVGVGTDLDSLLARRSIDLDQEVAATFVNVGHGTSVIIQFPNGQTMLYDVGSMSGGELAGRRVAATLRATGISHLDAVVLSHSDSDHYNGMPILARQFSIGCLHVEPTMLDSPDPNWEAVRRELAASGIRIAPLRQGQSCRLSSGSKSTPPIRLEVLHPRPDVIASSDNQRSIVLRLTAYGQSLLLTGDMEQDALRDFIERQTSPCDVLMAPHHGSGTTPIHDLVERFHPKAVVISGATHRRSGEVERRYSTAGASVFQTARDGAILIHMNPDGTSINSFRNRAAIHLATHPASDSGQALGKGRRTRRSPPNLRQPQDRSR